MTREGLGLPIAHEVESIHAVIGLVAGGLGIGFLPQSASVIRLTGVCYKPFEETSSPRSEMRLVWRKSETSLAVFEAVQLLREASRSMAELHPAYAA